MTESFIPEKPQLGMVRVYVAPGGHLTPQLINGRSTSGHAWSVLDIPVEDYVEAVAAIEEYRKTQTRLRQLVDSSKRYCVCGSDHAYLPEDLDP